MKFLVILNVLIFLFLSVLHIYWAAGGTRYSKAVIPQIPGGRKTFNPSSFITLLVAAGLLLFAMITAGNLGLFDAIISTLWIRYGTYAIGAIFLLRAIGDFKYVGVFKKVQRTGFARNDTKICTPLCVIIVTISFLIAN